VRSTLDTYLGWEQPKHFEGCKRPVWVIDFRTDEDNLRARHGGCRHSCANEECGHGDRAPRLTVRIVCHSCQATFVVDGEDASGHWGTAKVTTWGYGLPPRRVAGLLLWPAEPLYHFGRLSTDEPFDMVVTGLGVKTVTEADVVGLIQQGRGKRDAVTWTAAAVPSPDGEYGAGQRIRWSVVSLEDKPLRSVAAAAKWVAARVAEHQVQGGAA
jgi:hypothetical protein